MMQDNYDWYEAIQPLHAELDEAQAKRIQARVIQQLPHSAERDKPMKPTSLS